MIYLENQVFLKVETLGAKPGPGNSPGKTNWEKLWAQENISYNA